MSGRREMEGLVAVTAAVRAAAEAQLGALRAEEATLRARLAELDGALRDRATTVTAEDAALRAGADLRWERWVDTRRRALNGELARLLARIEEARRRLARDHGRSEVASELAREMRARLAAEREGRAERGW